MERRKILVIGMFDSIHLARWLSQFKDQDLKCKMLLQIHDELVFESSVDNIKKSKADIVEIMSKASEPDYKFSIPLSVDIKEGLNWTTAH